MTGPVGEPSRPAGRADATGPLPVTAPADATGPMPIPVPVTTPAQQAPGPGDPTGPQPLPDAPEGTAQGAATGPVPPPSSWFATEGDPVEAATTGPTGALPADAPPTGPSAQVDEAFVEHAPPVVAEAPDVPGADAPPPRTTLFEAVTPAQAGAGTAPPTSLFEAIAPPQPDTGTPPATSLFEAATPPQPATGTPPPTSLFEAIAPPQADTGTPPSTSLFEPVRPHDTAAAPASSLFEAVGPAGAPGTGAAGPGGQQATVLPIDVTGPMPALGAAPAFAPMDGRPRTGGPSAGGAPPATTVLPLIGADGRTSTLTTGTVTEAGHETALVPTPPAQPPSHTDAWSFGPNSGALPRPDPSAAKGRTGRPARVTSEPPPVPPAPSPLSGTRRRRSTWPLTVLGVLAAVAAGIALVFWIARTDPDDLVAAAAADLGNWNAVHYRGAMAALDGGEIQFDVIVTPEGASGTLTRDGGRATAEVLQDESGTLLRANRNWWLYHHGARADDLADTWVSEPLTETQEIDPVLALHPAALAQYVRPEQSTGVWEAVEQQIVEGQPAIVLSDGTRRVLVATDEPHQLLALDITATERNAPVQVTDVSPDEADVVESEAAGVRSAEAPRTLAQRLRERPLVEIQLQPEPLCVTETCGVTVTVTNSGAVAARGHLEISADGNIVANHPLEVHPGQVATFTAAAPNPHFANPGATGEILWESRAVDD